jgi:DNA polymerase-3 subunit beta
MELVVTKEQLSYALALTASLTGRKSTMPILSNVLITAEEGCLRVLGSDIELTTVASVPAKVKKAGSTTLSAKLFSDIVRELPDGDVTLKLVEGERVEIITHASKLKMVGASATEYPSINGTSLKPSGEIATIQLLDMINKTIYAVSLDENRYNLSGVCLEVISEGKKGAQLRMVATDGHRLAVITRPAGSLQFEGRIIVPKKGLLEIKKLLNPEQEEHIKIDVQEGFLILEGKRSKISIRLVDSEYPDYSAVIPKGNGTIAIVPSRELIQALRRTSLIVTDRSKCVKLDFTEDTLKISSSSPELGEAAEELTCAYKGKHMSIGFNAHYVIDFASSLGEDQRVSLELNGEHAGAKFTAEGDESYFGVVMPMRL